jgi:hypothetical protein
MVSAELCACGHKMWLHNPPRVTTLNPAEECRRCDCPAYRLDRRVVIPVKQFQQLVDTLDEP